MVTRLLTGPFGDLFELVGRVVLGYSKNSNANISICNDYSEFLFLGS